jgi:hypothetical protein
MADLTQSSASTATTAPQYYTDYLTNLATKGTAAGAAVSPTAWDPTALQTKAFENVATNVGNYQPGLAAAGTSFGKAGATDISGAANPYLTAGTTTGGLAMAQPNLTAGTSSAADLVGGYMNPYTQNVVDQIRLANQQNIQQNLSPGITAGAVGGGQFGSKRGAEALALGISNANIGALGQQTAALQSGYADALKAAQQQRANQLTAAQTAGTLQNQANINQVTAGQVAGNVAGQQGQLYRDVGTGQATLADQLQKAGLTDVNALATLGGQEQTIAQNKALMPLDVLGKQASIMSGAQLPMTTTSTMTGSPLSMIAGLGAAATGIFSQPVVGKNPDGTPIYGSNLWNTIKGSFGSAAEPSIPAGGNTTDTSGAGSSTAPTVPNIPLPGEGAGYWDYDPEGTPFWVPG